MKKKFLLTFILIIISMVAFCGISVSADSTGTCGNNLTWILDESGNLTISGTGDMRSWSYDSNAPWYSSRENITRVTICDGVTSIGHYAFYNCSNLMSITIPEGITSIDAYAFYNCSSLLKISIPKSIEGIGNYAFYNCSSLTGVYITDIAAWCNISYPIDKGKYIAESNPLYYAKNLYLNNNLAEDVIIPNTVKEISHCAFYNCRSLKSVTLFNGVTTIDSYAFYNCSNLTSIAIPDSVTFIGDYTFYNCSSITNITIPDGVTFVGDYTFYNCSSITNIAIPDGVTFIDDYAFYNCSKLTSAKLPITLKTIDNNAFANCSSLSQVCINDIGAWCKISFNNSKSNPLYYAKKLYLNNELIELLVIPETVDGIEDYVFYNYSSIKYIVFPNGLNYVKNYAFSECTNLSHVFFEGTEDYWNNEFLIYTGNNSIDSAAKVFDATEKTYKFVTNCGNPLDDIVTYALFDMPIVENDGMTLSGWYDNASLSGESITFPYYGNATTLYAAWADRSGKSFDDAFVANVNQEYTVTTTESGQLVYFEFVPNYSKEYHFYTTGSKDTYGYLYNSDKSQLAYNDDSGDGNNFYISYNLTAGETYYIATKLYSGTGTFAFVVEEPVDYRINEITIKDMSGNSLQTIPTGTFLTTVSFTNVSSSADTVIILVQYTDTGAFKGLMYIQTEDVPTGSTIKLSIPVDNSNGDVATLKAFCWESFGSLTPMGNSVSFPAE